MKYLRVTVILLMIFVKGAVAQTEALVSSPDKRIAMKLILKDRRLYYSVDFDGKAVIEPSLMGLRVNEKPEEVGTELKILNKNIINERYAWRGTHNMAVDYSNVSKIRASGKLAIEVKVSNDGVAFRYIVANRDSAIVDEDNTGFKIPARTVVWAQSDIAFYEGEYKERPIEDIKEGALAGPPLTMKLPDHIGYAAITEGGVTDFAGMSLVAKGGNMFKAKLDKVTRVFGEIVSPWRIIEIGRDLNVLVNCDIIANVSPKPDRSLFPKGFSTDWVIPGKSVWSWLANNGDVTFENMKRYSKWAGQLGIEYNLVDAGWESWHDGGKDKWTLLRELVDYSKEQHVRIWIWKPYRDKASISGTKDSIFGIKDSQSRHEFLTKARQAGVAGIKIDFFDEETQDVMKYYQAALKDAAKLHLMIDFHGADKPTGQSRTWPNEMTREGIRGLEYGSSKPTDNTTLPFTRYLAGHGDYTPLSFLQQMVSGSTLAHQVATLVTFTSPFMCLGVNPAELLSSPVKDFVVEIPTVWDETIVLPPSEIGEIAIYARRKGSVWYLSVLNGDQKKDLKLDFSFLGEGSYHAVILEDDREEIGKVKIGQADLKREDNKEAYLLPGGGMVIRFVKS